PSHTPLSRHTSIFFNAPAPTQIYTLSLHDALPISGHKDPHVHLYMLEVAAKHGFRFDAVQMPLNVMDAHFRSFQKLVLPELVKRSEEHKSELQSQSNLVCRLLLEKKKKNITQYLH